MPPTATHVSRPPTTLFEILARYDQLSLQTRAIVAPFLVPPSYSDSWMAQTGQGMSQTMRPSPAAGPVCGTLLPSWKWVESGHNHVRVWYQADRPADLVYALEVLDRIDTVIWPQLTGLMGRDPLSDGDERCNGASALLDLYLIPTHVRAQAVPYHQCVATPG